MTASNELIDQLLAGYKKPEDLIGENGLLTQLAEAKLANALQAEAAKKDAEIQALQAELAASETARQLAVNEAVGLIARERDGLKNDLNLIAVKNQLEEKAIK